MTNLNLQLRFEQRLQNHIAKVLDIRTIDVEFYLNEGLRRFVDEWYRSYETNEAARKRLGPLVVSTTVVSAGAGSFPLGTLYNLPADCKYVVHEHATTALPNCHGAASVKTGVTIKPIKLDYYNFHIDNPFKQPYNDLIWRIDSGSRQHELVRGSDTTSITTYYVTYIKNPASITLLTGTPTTSSCEILAEYHEEIVDKAIEVAIETFKLTNSFKINP